jgi:CHAD domain-containing protein
MVAQTIPTFDSTVAETSQSLGVIAYQSIKKHFKKTIKQKKLVLQDTDPEPLHQMRVGIRRLRTAFAVFGATVAVPDAITDRALSRLAKRLGSVRDLDILLIWLETYRQTADLSDAELTHLATVRRQLETDRKQCFQRMRKYLKGEDYQALVAAFKTWLAAPQYRPVALMPLVLVLPDLLLPLVSEVLQHPGWLVGTKMTADGTILPLQRLSLNRINQCLREQGPLLHDLRKRMKHVRYQTEFFLGHYGLAYAAQVKEFRTLQDVLGILQDEAVISDFLSKTLGKDWSEHLPSLVQTFEQERRETWRQWQALQMKYLDPTFRQTLRQQLISPTVLAVAAPEWSSQGPVENLNDLP